MIELSCPRCGTRAFGEVSEIDDYMQRHVSTCEGWTDDAPLTRVMP